MQDASLFICNAIRGPAQFVSYFRQTLESAWDSEAPSVSSVLYLCGITKCAYQSRETIMPRPKIIRVHIGDKLWRGRGTTRRRLCQAFFSKCYASGILSFRFRIVLLFVVVVVVVGTRRSKIVLTGESISPGNCPHLQSTTKAHTQLKSLQ